MANFGTHVSSSILVGAAYGTVGHLSFEMPLPSAAMAAGLCTLGGILPDIDSDHGVILRESLGLVAAVAPLLTFDRLAPYQLPRETTILILAGLYLAIRFGLGTVLRRWTIHRGMWHSIPAALTAGAVIYYLCSCPVTEVRLYKAGAITLGYLWHLLLDEIYAVDARRVRLKKSFGTALKMWGNKPLANLMAYGLLIGILWANMQDPSQSRAIAPNEPLDLPQHATRPLPPSPFEFR